MVIIVTGNRKSSKMTQIILIRKGNNNNYYLFVRIITIAVDYMRIQIILQIFLEIIVRIHYSNSRILSCRI